MIFWPRRSTHIMMKSIKLTMGTTSRRFRAHTCCAEQRRPSTRQMIVSPKARLPRLAPPPTASRKTAYRIAAGIATMVTPKQKVRDAASERLPEQQRPEENRGCDRLVHEICLHS